MAKTAKVPGPQLTPSWELVDPNFVLIKRHYIVLMYLLVLPALLYTLANLLTGPLRFTQESVQTTGSSPQLGGTLLIISLLWLLVNQGPTTYFVLQAAAGKTLSLRDAYNKGLRFSVRLVGLYIMFGIMLLIGLLLLIVPAFYVLRRYYLSAYYLVDKDLSIIQALRASAADSKPVSSAIWGIIGVQLVVSLAAAGVGLIPYIGLVISQLLGFAIIFVQVLRYQEIPKQKI